MQLTTNGQSIAAILMPRNASVVERFAATELRKYLQKISGACLPLLMADPAAVRSAAHQQPTIIIGKAPHLRADDSFTIIADEYHVRLLGKDDTGVLYSVYTFLEVCLGVCWLLPGVEDEHVPACRTLRVAPMRLTEAPAFRCRMIAPLPQMIGNLALFRKIIDLLPKLKLNYLLLFAGPYNFMRHSVSWDAMRTDLLPEINKRAIKIDLGHHCFDYFLPAEQYFAKHPEYFALIKGQRQAKDAQFCTRNPAAIAAFRANVLCYLKSHPEVRVLSLFPNDYHGFCECRRCRAIPPERRVLDLVCTIAKAVQQAAPDIQVAHSAYTLYDLKPPAQTRLPPNVLLYFAPWHRCYAHGFYDPHCRINRPYVRALQQWRRLRRAKVVFYDYYVTANFSTNMLAPFTELIPADLRTHLRVGLRGVVNSFSEIRNWRTYGFNLYLYAKTLWNVKSDPRQLRREFCQACFGRGWRLMESAYTRLENIRRHEENYIKIDILGPRGMGNPEDPGKVSASKAIRDLDNILRHMAQARQLTSRARAAAEEPVAQRRIRQVGLTLSFSLKQMEQLQRVFRLKELYWRRRNAALTKSPTRLVNNMRREYARILKNAAELQALFIKHQADMVELLSFPYFRRRQKWLRSLCQGWLRKFEI